MVCHVINNIYGSMNEMEYIWMEYNMNERIQLTIPGL